MTKALGSALLFEAAALAVSALAWVLGQPAWALLLFVASHLPGSLLMFPVLVVASALFDVYQKGGGVWSSVLPIPGVGLVVAVQVPFLIAFFHWHMMDGGGQVQWSHAFRSLRILATASFVAFLVAIACLWLTPLRCFDNCLPATPDKPSIPPSWQFNCLCEKFATFGTLQSSSFSTATSEWWGLFRDGSPWRFAMLGLYTVIGAVPGIWIVARLRGHGRSMGLAKKMSTHRGFALTMLAPMLLGIAISASLSWGVGYGIVFTGGLMTLFYTFTVGCGIASVVRLESPKIGLPVVTVLYLILWRVHFAETVVAETSLKIQTLVLLPFAALTLFALFTRD